MSFTRPQTLIMSVVIALLGIASVSGPALGQGVASPTGEEEESVARSAFVSQGTCADLGPEARFTLSDVVVAAMSTPSDEPTDDRQSLDADELDIRLADLLAEPHAVVVREHIEDPASTIACGDIDGTVGGGILSIGLEEQHDSGYAGLARLLEDGDQTVITTYLTLGLAGTASAESEPDLSAGCGCGPSGPSDATAIEVTIIDFLFLPSVLQVKPGTMVTWVNDGPGDHTVTVFQDGQLIADSGVLAAGQSSPHRFDEPGAYQYLSTLDPAMTAWIVVVP